MVYFRPLIICLAVVLIISCSEDEKQDVPPVDTEDGSWVIYSPLKWGHDGYPVTGNYCKVYSDEASMDLKLQCLDFADSMFGEVLAQFNFDNMGDLILPPENDKINVYINAGHPENIAYAYWGTIFITVRTTVINTSMYEYLFKHELTHEFEFMIEGTVNLGTDVWFRESIAIYAGGGFNRINTIEDLEEWISANEDFPGQGNPVMIHAWEDFPEGSDIDGYYWYAFDITMRYLLDPMGLNKSCQDVLSLFYDIRAGVTFEIAFQNNFGIGLKTFEEEFYDRIRNYLIIQPE